MNILIMGPAGSGKGTMSSRINEYFKVAHISTGDMLRENVKNDTPLGHAAKDFMKEGRLVPDDLINEMVKERIQESDTNFGYLMDGFPRTLAQAEALSELMSNMGISLDKVISLNVPDELIVGRITGRRVCSKCGASFHVEFNPSKKEDECDYCGGELIIRKDDNAETVISRLNAYHEQTSPLIAFYTKMGVFVELDGTKDVSEVTADMMASLS